MANLLDIEEAKADGFKFILDYLELLNEKPKLTFLYNVNDNQQVKLSISRYPINKTRTLTKPLPNSSFIKIGSNTTNKYSQSKVPIRKPSQAFIINNQQPDLNTSAVQHPLSERFTPRMESFEKLLIEAKRIVNEISPNDSETYICNKNVRTSSIQQGAHEGHQDTTESKIINQNCENQRHNMDIVGKKQFERFTPRMESFEKLLIEANRIVNEISPNEYETYVSDTNKSNHSIGHPHKDTTRNISTNQDRDHQHFNADIRVDIPRRLVVVNQQPDLNTSAVQHSFSDIQINKLALSITYLRTLQINLQYMKDKTPENMPVVAKYGTMNESSSNASDTNKSNHSIGHPHKDTTRNISTNQDRDHQHFNGDTVSITDIVDEIRGKIPIIGPLNATIRTLNKNHPDTSANVNRPSSTKKYYPFKIQIKKPSQSFIPINQPPTLNTSTGLQPHLDVKINKPSQPIQTVNFIRRYYRRTRAWLLNKFN